jgi:hypothetical protein
MRTLILLSSILGMLLNYILSAHKINYINVLLFGIICIIILINVGKQYYKDLEDNESWKKMHK